MSEQLWEDGEPIQLSVMELKARSRHPSVIGTATEAWNSKKRKKAANKGQALKDGSYPIADVADLKKAIQALGRAKNRAKVVRHIKKRAKALGQMDLVKDLKERI